MFSLQQSFRLTLVLTDHSDNSRALATVTAIIDGTISVGAALGPLSTGFISSGGWNNVFVMLMIAALVSGLLLTRLVTDEVKEKVHKASRCCKSFIHIP